VSRHSPSGKSKDSHEICTGCSRRVDVKGNRDEWLASLDSGAVTRDCRRLWRHKPLSISPRRSASISESLSEPTAAL